MTKHFLCLFAILLLAINFSFGQNTIDVKPDPTREYQTIEGWGSSLCWWAHMIGQWQDEQKIDQIVDLITSPDKLNMNIFRYNIGGGDDPSHYSTPGHPGHMASGKGVRAEMPGFKLSETAPYDWTADAGQRRILLKIKEKRPDAIFEAFSNSPPYWMTYSGCSAGNNPANADNLKPDYYGQFCDYLVEVCKHYKDTFGVEFKTLEPFNESLSNYWGYLGGQEGCHFDVSSQISLLRVLYPKLQDSGLNTVISASDETNISSFIYATNNYIGAGDIIGKLGQQNTHTYSGSDAERREAYNLTRETGKTFWMSETGPSGISESGLTNNLQLAQKMFNDLRYMKPSAWIDWQLMEEGNDTWCQLRADFGNETYAIVKNFYVRMQVTRFIKKGYRLIESGNDHVLTAVSPDGDQLAVVVLNQSQSGESFSIDLSKFPQTGRSAQTYRTSSSENCQRIADSNTSDQHLNYFAPAQSITSFVIPVKFTRYSQFQLIKGIHFENDSLGGFEGQNLNLAENPRTNGLNNSIHSLSINLSTNPEFFYQLEDTFYTSNDYRYLHIMSYSADAEGSANNSSDSIIRIDAGNEWKDQVIDLGENNSFMQLAFQSSASSGTLLLDNICINGDPHPRTVSKEAPTFDFESSQGTPLLEIRSTPGHHPSTNIAINKKIVGLNTTHQFLEYISPVVKNPINTEDTLVIQLGSPLQITSATRYLHV
ncbi:MAG TPA: glycoside hydrolase, partial [Sunxiuqinia sp.]|nr:glycoside hydrolase [Sunxiuqinia sp.]